MSIHVHAQTQACTHTVSFSHANLTYESSWLSFNAAPPLTAPPRLPPSPPSHHPCHGWMLQTAAVLLLLPRSHGHLATAGLLPALTGIWSFVATVLQSEGLRVKAESRPESEFKPVGRSGPATVLQNVYVTAKSRFSSPLTQSEL